MLSNINFSISSSSSTSQLYMWIGYQFELCEIFLFELLVYTFLLQFDDVLAESKVCGPTHKN